MNHTPEKDISFRVIIPARFGSSRLPGKPLLPIAGKPMVQHVYERALACGAQDVIVATDDQRIADCVKQFGGYAMLTDSGHASGTDRLAEVVSKQSWPDDDIIVNIQGDEPMIDPKQVNAVAHALMDSPSAGIATLATPITEQEDIFNPNIVKVVTDGRGMALYFSRAPVPWVRSDFHERSNRAVSADIPLLRHIGLYAYRCITLKSLTRMPPCELETAEALEQLRALWHGIGIQVTIVDDASCHGVDTEEDLRYIEAQLGQAQAVT